MEKNGKYILLNLKGKQSKNTDKIKNKKRVFSGFTIGISGVKLVIDRNFLKRGGFYLFILISFF